tara:strand:+ start:2468 stop:3001 length:534 start_codon:yes stop_codon:yes gene_type:complete
MKATKETKSKRQPRELIKFNEGGYNQAVINYNTFATAALRLQEEALALGVDLSVKELLRAKSPLDTVVSMVFAKQEGAPSGVDKVKYLELFNINLGAVRSCALSFDSVKEHSEKPQKESFNIYATTNDEIARIKEDKRVLAMCNELLDLGIASNPVRLNQVLSSKFMIEGTRLVLRG